MQAWGHEHFCVNLSVNTILLGVSEMCVSDIRVQIRCIPIVRKKNKKRRSKTKKKQPMKTNIWIIIKIYLYLLYHCTYRKLSLTFSLWLLSRNHFALHVGREMHYFVTKISGRRRIVCQKRSLGTSDRSKLKSRSIACSQTDFQFKFNLRLILLN